jgi:flavorubredoxin
VGDRIYRFSTFVEPAGLTFNQYLLDGDEPFLFHTGMKALFPLVTQAVGTVRPIEQIRWLSFGHFEADECGSMNDWLAAAPNAEVVFGELGCLVSINDQAIRLPQPIKDGEVFEVGDRRLRYLATPHVPHNWEAGIFFEETTSTLLCGDLFTTMGNGPAITTDDIVEPAIASEALSGLSFTTETAPTLRRLAELAPTTLTLMHGPAFHGDGAAALSAFADHAEARLRG